MQRLPSLVVLAVLLLLAGCRSSRTVTIEETPPTSVNTRVDSIRVRPPPLKELRRADIQLSYPAQVRAYSDTLRSDVTIDLVEAVIEDGVLTLRTPTGETRHVLPPRGQRKTIRPRPPETPGDTTSPARIEEYVEGDPAPHRTTVTVPEEEGTLDKFNRLVIWLVVLLMLVILALIILGRRA